MLIYEDLSIRNMGISAGSHQFDDWSPEKTGDVFSVTGIWSLWSIGKGL
jgi:hypothetical protein